MNDDHEPDDRDDRDDQDRLDHLDPTEQERVRALLADLATAPDAARMPPDVAARLEETLADLAAEGRRTPAEVIPLRRRWALRGAAAAAVVVVGLGGVAAAQGLFGSGSSSDTAASGSAADTSPGSAAQGSDATSRPAPRTPGSLAPGLAAGLPEVEAASFGTDVARVLQSAPLASGSPARQREAARDGASTGALAAGCAGPRTTDAATTTQVLYDGTPAVLVIHPVRGGDRLVEAWTCGGDRRLDSTRIPAGTTGEDGSGDPGRASSSPTP